MSINIKAAILGDKALQVRLEGLKRGVRNKILRPAVSAAARPLRQTAKANVPVRSGALRKAIDMKIKSGRQTVFGVVGPRSRPQVLMMYAEPGRRTARKVVPNFYAHLVEGGTRPHAVGKGSKLRKRGTIAKASRRAVLRGVRAESYEQRGGMHPGTPAVRFLARAFASNLSAMRGVMESKVREGLEKHA